ncbi:MAG: L-rhamnose isomerase [Victivallaceae bacterium]|nr:L-rhamnose isomerase [Victivallaceae bacterium]
MNTIEKSYKLARERYAAMRVDCDVAMDKLEQIAISIHCWQGDDVAGFENPDIGLSGGIQATGNYPGKAHTADQLRQDLDKALSFIPGTHRLNLHAIYAETNGATVERDQLETKYFQNWIDWAKQNNMGLDFNPTMFSHPNADDGFTLSHADKGIRDYWIAHSIACRKIATDMGQALGSPCVNNIWIPDGSKDTPVDRKNPRLRLQDSLNKIFASANNPEYLLDAVECKLFGIGSESYVVGSHEFYMGYATANNKLLCLDAGHFHPTEVISDKISSVMTFVDEILLHVSRGVRWDSDHVVTLSDELYAIAQEIVRGDFIERVHVGLDFFDASINRIAAWVIGTRAMQKALLAALLEPTAQLRGFEAEGDNSSRLAMLEELKTMPFGAVWDYFCAKHETGVGFEWMAGVKQYEKDVLALR